MIASAWPAVLAVVDVVVLLLLIAAMLAAFGRVERHLDELEQGFRSDLGAWIREQREAEQARPAIPQPGMAPPTPRRADP